MSYFPTDIPFMSDEELIENGLKKPYKKPEIINSKDLAPVVRCRDCEYLENRTDCSGKCWKVSGFGVTVRMDDFCSHGKRREE